MSEGVNGGSIEWWKEACQCNGTMRVSSSVQYFGVPELARDYGVCLSLAEASGLHIACAAEL